jgi:hypothetical protein
MCEERVDAADVVVGVGATQAPALVDGGRPGMEAEIVSLWAVVNDLRQELVELRMGQRKALLEELAALERPLVEQGVLAQRTREPRHRREGVD